MIQRRFKIAHLTTVHRQDDVRIFLKECRSLARSGYEIFLISPGTRHGRSDGVNIISVPVPGSRIERMLRTNRLVYRAAVALDADLYHFHDPELMFAGMLLKMKGKRVVYDVHEELGEDIRDKEWLPKWVRPIMAVMVGIFESVVARLCDGVVVSRSALLKRFQAHKTVLVSNYPIVGELLKNDSTAFAQRPRIGAYVGGLSVDRGIWQLVDGLGHLPESCAFELHVAGDLPASLREEVEKKPGAKRIRFLGWQTREQVAVLLNQARFGIVLFLPIANHVRSEPTKIYEYMSGGLPIIASDMPYWRTLVENNGFGIVVDPYDPQAISDSIEYLVSHPEEAEAMGRRGKTAIFEEFNWGHEMKKLLLLYANILN